MLAASLYPALFEGELRHGPVAAHPTRTASLDRPAAPIPCPRIMLCRTSCGPPNPVAGAVCRAMIGCFRHCGGHDAHRGADADA